MASWGFRDQLAERTHGDWNAVGPRGFIHHARQLDRGAGRGEPRDCDSREEVSIDSPHSLRRASAYP